MMLNIQQLQAKENVCVDVDAQQCDLPSDIGKIVAPIHLEACVRKVEKEVTIEGRIATTIEMNCARCLKLYQEALDDAFEVIYHPRPGTEKQSDEIELDKTDLNVSYYEGESISIATLLRDQLLLLLPVKPLCKPDCAGLCPSCGQDLNEGPCTCAKDTIDPRLAVLRQLLKQRTSEM
jgi:uncharacterized protein